MSLQNSERKMLFIKDIILYFSVKLILFKHSKIIYYKQLAKTSGLYQKAFIHAKHPSYL